MFGYLATSYNLFDHSIFSYSRSLLHIPAYIYLYFQVQLNVIVPPSICCTLTGKKEQKTLIVKITVWHISCILQYAVFLAVLHFNLDCSGG